MCLIALVACGGTQTPAPEEHHEMAMPPELKKFHDVLAPHWHAAKGEQRMKDTCAALPEFHADADALAKATPPRSTHADTWTNGTKQLVDSLAGLDSACKANDAAAFETAFGKVHESFHVLLEASSDEHEHHT